MRLVINTRGAFLKKSKNCFLIKNDDKVFEVSANKVDSIMITTSATITTDAIKFAVDNNIDIVFMDYFGNPYGRLWHSKLGSTTLIRRRQLEIHENADGLKLAKKWVVRKLDNHIDFLKDLKKTRPKERDAINGAIEKIEVFKDRLKKLSGTIYEKRQNVLGLEGISSREYLGAVSKILPKKYRFKERSRNPAKDEFNCLLNYGYGVLYSRVEKACIIAGLDPYVGILHTDNYNKTSFVFDLIEIFRIYVDRTVVHLFSKRKIKDNYFDKVPGGLTLNKDGKAVLIGALNETFEKKVNYRGRNVKAGNTMQMECHRIANGLIR